MIMTIGFSGAFYILFTPDVGQATSVEEVPSGFVDFQSTLLSTFLMILGSFDISTFMESTPHSEMAIAMFCLYQVLGMIVLLNLLIAIMGVLRLLSKYELQKRHQSVRSIHEHVFRNNAAKVQVTRLTEYGRWNHCISGRAGTLFDIVMQEIRQ